MKCAEDMIWLGLAPVEDALVKSVAFLTALLRANKLGQSESDGHEGQEACSLHIYVCIIFYFIFPLQRSVHYCTD